MKIYLRRRQLHRSQLPLDPVDHITVPLLFFLVARKPGRNNKSAHFFAACYLGSDNGVICVHGRTEKLASVNTVVTAIRLGLHQIGGDIGPPLYFSHILRPDGKIAVQALLAMPVNMIELGEPVIGVIVD